jgi:hypothetical protein
MTSPTPNSETLKTLIVEVRRHRDGRITFRQPPDRYTLFYRVYDQRHQEPRIVIFSLVCPVYLQFNANVPLTAIGFAEMAGGGPVSRHNTPGPCGGCFSLVTGFDGTFATPLIRNQGDPQPQGRHYRFTLWTNRDGDNDVVLTAGIDPQIYNQGDGQDEL